MTKSIFDKPSTIKYILVTAVISLVVGLVVTLVVSFACGYRLRIVSTNSMEPNIKVGTLIIESSRAYEELQVGDVITYFRTQEKDVKITHRIISIEDNVILVKGDNANETAVDKVTQENYVGCVVMTIPYYKTITDYISQNTFTLLFLFVMTFIGYHILLM